MGLAPIILFTYNRPEHTRATVTTLHKNKLAEISDLIVYSDGYRNQSDEMSVAQVRNYLKDIHGFKSIEIIERPENTGLADNIISGVTEVLKQYNKAIIMEDDIVTAPGFLKYMNQALDYYSAANRVMHITGYSLPITTKNLGQAYFYRAPTCWGWGTWSTAWESFSNNVAEIEQQFSPAMINDFNLGGGYDFWSHLQANKTGRIKTWAIFWYASIFLNSGLCLHPAQSLTRNIGHDRSGTYSGGDWNYQYQYINHAEDFDLPVTVEESDLALRRIVEFYRKERSLTRRISRITKRFLGHK